MMQWFEEMSGPVLADPERRARIEAMLARLYPLPGGETAGTIPYGVVELRGVRMAIYPGFDPT
jgi:hypothetical protein